MARTTSMAQMAQAMAMPNHHTKVIAVNTLA